MTNGKQSPSAANVHLALKARVVDDQETVEERLFNFMQSMGNVAQQEDVYFKVNSGQMKLRLTNTSKDYDIGQLITARTLPGSTSNLVETQSTDIQDFKNTKKTLSLCLPVLGSIKKRRRVYVKDNVRINLDYIDSLGANFLDIEIHGSDEEKLASQAEIVKRELQISDSQLIKSTYLELYRKLKTADSGFDDDSSDN